MIKIKNWDDLQHYKDRNPPWIKFHKQVMDSYEWHCLQDASKSLLITIWVIASEGENWKTGTIPNDPQKIAFRARKDPKDVLLLTKELIRNGFIEISNVASDLLAPCYQIAVPETETETETEVLSPPKVENEKKQKNACRIPPTWECSEELGKWALEQGMSYDDVVSEIENFIDYWTAASGSKARKHNWDAAFRTWIRNTVKWKKDKK